MSLATVVPKLFQRGNIRRIARVLPESILGNGAEVAGKAMRETKGSLFTKAEKGFLALEKDIKEKEKLGGFFKRITSNLGEIPKLAKEGFTSAKAAGKSSILGGIKGTFKGLGKNMPFIAAASTILFELPNIWSATKEQGIGQGITEVAKAGTRLAGGAAGAAIGSAICPGIGTFLGWIAGEWLTSKVVGKSYTEKKEEMLAKEQEAAMNQQQIQQPAFTGNPYEMPSMTNPMYGYNDYMNPYADDIMMNNLNFNTIA